ncbi:helix-turn-helix transcriptional regulator [Salmonella enterica]|nr:helix-turn-helix transcriptional regulator [Salmonella enterica]
MLNLRLLDKMSQLSATELREARLLLGLDQVDFGRLLGLNRRTVSRLECERYPIPVTVVLSVRFLLAVAGVRDFTFTKSPIVPSSRSVAPPVASAPASVPQPADVPAPMAARQSPKKSGKNRKKKRRGF